MRNLFKLHPIMSSFIVALILLAAGASVFKFRDGDTESVRVKTGPIVEAVYGIGTVTSNQMFRGRIAQADGIRTVFVQEGATVSKGAKLLQLEDGSTMYAPFSGTVTSLPFYAGENVLPGTTIVTVQNLKDLFIRATLEQQGAMRVRPNQNVRLNFESFRNQTFNGLVRSVYPQESQFIVDISVSNLPSNILPAMTADVAIEIAKRERALLVPVRAISGGKLTLDKQGKSVKVEVGVGSTDGEWAEITSGDISEDDQVLIPEP